MILFLKCMNVILEKYPIKQGIEEAGSVLKEFGERLPSLIEGFMSAFEDKAE